MLVRIDEFCVYICVLHVPYGRLFDGELVCVVVHMCWVCVSGHCLSCVVWCVVVVTTHGVLVVSVCVWQLCWCACCGCYDVLLVLVVVVVTALACK